MNQATSAFNGIDSLQSRVLIIVFLALLWLPTFDSLWHLDHCPAQNENREAGGFSTV